MLFFVCLKLNRNARLQTHTHAKVWWRAAFHDELPKKRKVSDSAAIYRWTDRRAGYSTPILFGMRSFSGGSRRVLLERVKDAPAIVSFFVRRADFDDALRIDVPASCLGLTETIDAVNEERLIDATQVGPILSLLAADYGGLEMYNALLYRVDREVRLRQEMLDEVYLMLIQDTLLLFGGGIGGLVTWVGWQQRKRRAKK